MERWPRNEVFTPPPLELRSIETVHTDICAFVSQGHYKFWKFGSEKRKIPILEYLCLGRKLTVKDDKTGV